MFEGQTCLITGGTGSWGQELVRRLLADSPKEIRILSRNEFKQVEMQRQLNGHGNIRFIIGDVRDPKAVMNATEGCDYVFHLAALKHVPICEQQPDEALKTNVLGTQHVIQASLHHGVKKVLDVSTDKAVNPHNFYGLTKAIGEKLMIHANQISAHTRFACIRGGNVLGTNGSVVPLFRRQIREGHTITLTDHRMTRFFLTIPGAIDLLMNAAKRAVGGETIVMRMPACKITDLAEVMAEELSSAPVAMKEIGMRQGEKLHEELVSGLEAGRTFELENSYYVILPPNPSTDLKASYGLLQPVQFTQYDSSQSLMNKPEIKHLLQLGGFLQ